MKRLIGILLPVFIATAAYAANFNDAQREELNGLIHDYLVAHPEVLKEMAQLLEDNEKKTQADVMSKAKVELYHNATDAVVGNPNGDVTVIEFMDYNCDYCKKAMNEMQTLVAKDPNLRVVFKEWPIFGADSEYAAKAAMAAAKQGKYWPLHQALFSAKGHVDAAVVDAAAKSVGIDVAKLKADMNDPAIKDNLDKTGRLATALQFTGTPGFLFGNLIVPGYIPQDKMVEAIARVRKDGCKDC